MCSNAISLKPDVETAVVVLLLSFAFFGLEFAAGTASLVFGLSAEDPPPEMRPPRPRPNLEVTFAISLFLGNK